MSTSYGYEERRTRINQMRDWNNDGRRYWGSYLFASLIERAGFSSKRYTGDSRIINQLEASSIIDRLEEHLNLEIIGGVYE